MARRRVEVLAMLEIELAGLGVAGELHGRAALRLGKANALLLVRLVPKRDAVERHGVKLLGVEAGGYRRRLSWHQPTRLQVGKRGLELAQPDE